MREPASGRGSSPPIRRVEDDTAVRIAESDRRRGTALRRHLSGYESQPKKEGRGLERRGEGIGEDAAGETRSLGPLAAWAKVGISFLK